MSTAVKPSSVLKALYPNASPASLVTTLASIAGAVITNTGTVNVGSAETAAVTAVAGILTALHIHVPRFLAKGTTTSATTESIPKELESLLGGIFSELHRTNAAAPPAATHVTLPTSSTGTTPEAPKA